MRSPRAPSRAFGLGLTVVATQRSESVFPQEEICLPDSTDAVGKCCSRRWASESLRYAFDMPGELSRLISRSRQETRSGVTSLRAVSINCSDPVADALRLLGRPPRGYAVTSAVRIARRSPTARRIASTSLQTSRWQSGHHPGSMPQYLRATDHRSAFGEFTSTTTAISSRTWGKRWPNRFTVVYSWPSRSRGRPLMMNGLAERYTGPFSPATTFATLRPGVGRVSRPEQPEPGRGLPLLQGTLTDDMR